MMVDSADPLQGVTGFDWDDGNIDKNWIKHGVRWSECEEVFSQRSLFARPDELHSKGEARYGVWGRTANRRCLAVVFTLRGSLVRIVTARDMNRAEKKAYENEEKAEADPRIP